QHTLMIVDDNRLIRETYRDLFQAEDFVVVEATNGAEALLWLQRKKAQLILLDLEMPVMDGRSFLEYRLAHAKIRKIPVLVVTSRPDDATLRQSLLNLGADRLLQKPVHLEKLVSAVREMLMTPRILKVWSPLEAPEASGRQDARVTFTVPIRVRSGAFVETRGRLRDLSAGGLGAYLPQRLPHGNTITVSLDIEGRSLALMGFVHWADASLTTMGYHHGIRFFEKQENSFPLYTYSFFREHSGVSH
ncbi:MAG: response regulator, partial [Candidatus Methylomirabilales bacterium]